MEACSLVLWNDIRPPAYQKSAGREWRISTLPCRIVGGGHINFCVASFLPCQKHFALPQLTCHLNVVS